MSKEIIKSIDTGLTISTPSYEATNGFVYASGIRKFGNLRIVEDVATGTAVSYLSGVKVFDDKDTLIIDKRMEKGCFYERETARKIVLEELLKLLIEQHGANENFDVANARQKINEVLKDTYFGKSYQSINAWANEIGIKLI